VFPSDEIGAVPKVDSFQLAVDVTITALAKLMIPDPQIRQSSLHDSALKCKPDSQSQFRFTHVKKKKH
jgi:hypothetical protein